MAAEDAAPPTDVYRDTPVRFLGYANEVGGGRRHASMALPRRASRNGRAHASEQSMNNVLAGESFKPVAPRALYFGSYAVACAYVAADAKHKYDRDGSWLKGVDARAPARNVRFSAEEVGRHKTGDAHLDARRGKSVEW